MPLCVVLNANGTLTPTGQPVDACAGYVLVSSAEYGVFNAVEKALGMPSVEEASALMVLVVGAVLFWYVVGRMGGAVANIFNRS